MESTNNSFQQIRPDAMKFEFRQVVGGNALDKPSSGEKFKRFMARFLSWGASIGSVVGRFFGPIGWAASAGLYGAKRLADGAVARMDNKKAMDAAYDQSAASMQGATFEAPGFNSFYQNTISNDASSESPSIQWAPFTKGLEKEVTTSLNNKSSMTSQLINQGVLG